MIVKNISRYISYIEDDELNIRGYGYWDETWVDIISICPTPFFAKADAYEYFEIYMRKE